MATLHIENTIHDFDDWKSGFDAYDQFRKEQGVRAYRVSRQVDRPEDVIVDLDFDSVEDAENFTVALDKIRKTPRSKELLVSHQPPRMLQVVEERQL